MRNKLSSIKDMHDYIFALGQDYNLNIECSSSGSLNSDTIIITDNPGDNEVRNECLMSGTTGKRLWETLYKQGLTPNNTYVTSVVKRRCGADAKVTRSEEESWQTLLLQELAELPNMKYIVVLGNYALRAILACDKITAWRGSVVTCTVADKSVTVLVANNPSMMFRDPVAPVIFAMDMNKLSLVRSGLFEPMHIDAHINPSFKEAYDFLKLLLTKEYVSYDIEWVGGEVSCIGFAYNANSGMCINFRDIDSNRYSGDEEIILLRTIQEVLLCPTIKLIAQNGSADACFLGYKQRIKVKPLWMDTLLAHHCLYATLPHNLGFLTAQYTNHPYYKDDGKTWKDNGDIDQLWTYNVKDCCITFAVAMGLLKELKSQKLDKFFFEHIMPIQPELIEMTLLGILADVDYKNKMAEEIATDVKQLETELLAEVRVLVNDPEYQINLLAWQSMQKLLFDMWHLEGIGQSTNATNRAIMIENINTPQVYRDWLIKYNKYRKQHKFSSVYLNSKIDDDNRIRCNYKQFGVSKAPGRLSSEKTFWGSGMNLQNQPKRAYPMVIADPGYTLIYFDYAQAELKIVAYLWEVKALIQAFERKDRDPSFDLHRANASRMYGIPYDDIPKEDEIDGEHTLRYIGKRCAHGLNYRMQPDRLAITTGLSIIQANDAFNRYHIAFPEIQRAWLATINEAKKQGYLDTPLGRRLRFFGQVTDDQLDSAIAFKPQATIGEMCARVIVRCHNDPQWPRDSNGNKLARVIMNIHDALVVLTPIDLVDRCMAIMKRHAEEPIKINNRMVSVGADFKVGTPDEHGIIRWSSLVKYTIEDDVDIDEDEEDNTTDGMDYDDTK